MKECIKRLWETLKTTFLNVKLQRLCKYHHLKCITSSKLEKYLCLRDKAENLCWMPVVFGALRRHCITHRHDYLIDITKWAQEYIQKSLSVNTIRHAICRCQLKLYHAKSKPYVNMVQKHRRVLWAESKFDIIVGIHGRRVLRAKEEGDPPACHQCSVQKPASLMVWGCI